MNAVWLNDELMVSPAAVAGMLVERVEDGFAGETMIGHGVSIILLSGVQRSVAWFSERHALTEAATMAQTVEGARGRTRALAEAEMERLSALLWPPEPEPPRPKRCTGFVGDRRCVRDNAHPGEHSLAWAVNTAPDIRIYDPELYGLAVCGVQRVIPAIPEDDEGKGRPASVERCNLALNHYLHGVPAHRFVP